MVKMMQKEATLAERAWEERTSQRDNNKVYFNHLTRDEAAIEMKIRMDKYQPDKEDDFSYSGNSLKFFFLKRLIPKTDESWCILFTGVGTL